MKIEMKKHLEELVEELTLRACKHLDDLLLDIETSWARHRGEGSTMLPYKVHQEMWLDYLYTQILFFDTDNWFTIQQYCDENYCYLGLTKKEYELLCSFHELVKKKLNLQKSISESLITFDSKSEKLTINGEKIRTPGKNTNQHNFLIKFLKNPNNYIPEKELIKLLNEPRSHADFAEESRRVRDTVRALRKNLKISEKILKANNRSYGLFCSVTLA